GEAAAAPRPGAGEAAAAPRPPARRGGSRGGRWPPLRPAPPRELPPWRGAGEGEGREGGEGASVAAPGRGAEHAGQARAPPRARAAGQVSWRGVRGKGGGRRRVSGVGQERGE